MILCLSENLAKCYLYGLFVYRRIFLALHAIVTWGVYGMDQRFETIRVRRINESLNYRATDTINAARARIGWKSANKRQHGAKYNNQQWITEKWISFSHLHISGTATTSTCLRQWNLYTQRIRNTWSVYIVNVNRHSSHSSQPRHCVYPELCAYLWASTNNTYTHTHTHVHAEEARRSWTRQRVRAHWKQKQRKINTAEERDGEEKKYFDNDGVCFGVVNKKSNKNFTRNRSNIL